MVEHAAGAAAAFAATDIDDLVILAVLFGAAEAGTGPRARDIVVGQYLGIAVLFAVGALGAFGFLFLSDEVVGLLGLIPLGLGVRGLLLLRRDEDDEDEPAVLLPPDAGILSVAGITIANGGDNLAVYVPFFASAGASGLPVVALVFAVMVGVWCAIGRAVGGHPVTVAAIERWGHVAVPIVLVVLGVAIIAQAGTISAIMP